MSNRFDFNPSKFIGKKFLFIFILTACGMTLLTLVTLESQAYGSRVRDNLLRSRDALLKQRSNLENQQRTIQFYLRDVDRSLRDVEYALRRTN